MLHCRHTIQQYRCPRCDRIYTALDIASFPIREFKFQCGECNDEGFDVALEESFHSQDGTLIDVKEKDRHVAEAKQMLVGRLFSASPQHCSKAAAMATFMHAQQHHLTSQQGYHCSMKLNFPKLPKPLE